MENLQRRPSGVYVARLVVPAHLRSLTGKGEFIASTRTTHLGLAKIIAGAVLVGWRQQLLELERLAVAGKGSMDHESIVKISDGHPLLAADTHLPIFQAARIVGVDPLDLIRLAGEGSLRLYLRVAQLPGHVLRRDALEVDDPELQTVVVPNADAMPAHALRRELVGVVGVLREDMPSLAADLIAAGEATLVALGVLHSPANQIFVPDRAMQVTPALVEVSTSELDAMRRRMSATISPGRLEAARDALRLAGTPTPPTQERNAHKLFSEALEHYTAKFLPQHISSPKEIQRVKTGMALLIEFEGDLPLREFDTDRIRHFRDVHLSRALARENDVRTRHKTTCMTESIAAVAGTDWPVMSAAERDLRMSWLGRMFGWLKDQAWIATDPTRALRGESVHTKAERKLAALAQKPREPFTPADLALIFGQRCFRTGSGQVTKAGTYREFQPFHYWLPLLGVYVGGRINELCQLRLDDVRVSEAGTWYFDINENTPDKSLKRQKDEARCWSARRVPVHSHLVALGFLDWCSHLRSQGFMRVFPELSWNPTNHYAKDPIRVMSQTLLSLGFPRDNTKVFHSFRHTFNNAVMRMSCPPEIRKRLMGHAPGEGVNEQHYLKDPSPEEAAVIIEQLRFELPLIRRFDSDAGLAAVRDALRRKDGGRGTDEALGPAR
jgi:integrase